MERVQVKSGISLIIVPVFFLGIIVMKQFETLSLRSELEISRAQTYRAVAAADSTFASFCSMEEAFNRMNHAFNTAIGAPQKTPLHTEGCK